MQPAQRPTAAATAPPLLAAARLRLAPMLDDVRALVEHESPSGDPQALRASALAVRDLVRRRLGEDAELIEVDGIIHVRRGPASPRILLLGHHDTVWPVGTLARLPFGVSRGVVRGPGCFDMKLGVVMAVHALALLRAHAGEEAVAPVGLLVTGDEEVGSQTSRTQIERDAAAAEAVLVLEAAADGGAPKVARKGTAQYVLDVAGRAAHAGLEPERGINAGVAVAALALAASRLHDPAGGTTVVPTRMEAGTTANTVPARARLHVDVRAWSTAELDRIDAELHRLETGVAGADDVMRPARRPDRRGRRGADRPHAAARRLRRLGAAGGDPAQVRGAVRGAHPRGQRALRDVPGRSAYPTTSTARRSRPTSSSGTAPRSRPTSWSRGRGSGWRATSPRLVELVDSLPMTATGKILKRELRTT